MCSLAQSLKLPILTNSIIYSKMKKKLDMIGWCYKKKAVENCFSCRNLNVLDSICVLDMILVRTYLHLLVNDHLQYTTYKIVHFFAFIYLIFCLLIKISFCISEMINIHVANWIFCNSLFNQTQGLAVCLHMNMLEFFWNVKSLEKFQGLTN